MAKEPKKICFHVLLVMSVTRVISHAEISELNVLADVNTTRTNQPQKLNQNKNQKMNYNISLESREKSKTCDLFKTNKLDDLEELCKKDLFTYCHSC